MKFILLISVLCATLMFATNSDYKYEITPMIGGVYSEGNLDLERNYVNAGLSLGFNLDDSMFNQVELGFLRSVKDVSYDNVNVNRDTGITRVFANLVKEYPLTNSTSLYGLIGGGVEFFDDEAFDNQNGVFANYGVGIKYKISEFISLKTDIRHFIDFNFGANNLLYTVGLAIPFGKKAAPAPMKMEPTPTPAPAPMDSDNDGVVDRLDNCPNTPKDDIVDDKGCSLKVNLNINFENNSSVINNAYSSKIKKFADFMKATPSVKAKIEAYTDSVGSDSYNQKLSERRAASTLKALQSYNIDSSRLNAIGYGEYNPKASNETAEGRAENRRIEGTIQR